MRTIEGDHRKGLMAIAFVILLVGVGSSITSVPMLFAAPTYYAEFADTGALMVSDKVRIAGVDVGDVKSMDIVGDKVKIGFTVGDHLIGTDSRASIRTDTILGKKNVEIEPRGNKVLRPRDTLPIGQTTTPYQIYDAFFDVTRAAQGWDTKSVRESLNVLSDTVSQTYPHLSAALDGVARFSDTIGKRDDQIRQLLANANKIAGVLGDRSGQINSLLVNAQTLLAAINERGRAVSALLERVQAVSAQVSGLIDDNPNLNHVLVNLNTLTDVLKKHKQDLANTLLMDGQFLTSLGEATGSGPYLKAMLVNLLPSVILQPFVDAAFKKRGIDPEQFWRNAGLPEFQFPDPNGTRFPNGAPPSAPQVREGTPDHPGPAVVPGSPCSYTPGEGALPTPADPLPCAHLDQGPYGPVPGGYGAPDVLSSRPNPNGPPASPGVPIAGLPGQTPPLVPGTPVALPNAPHGARTEPVGPAAGPLPPPAYLPLPLPGPPPPVGPGPQLPVGTGG
jgi:phospholipid/cholesterol/gamma-HCH transport system substrate-binding protein